VEKQLWSLSFSRDMGNSIMEDHDSSLSVYVIADSMESAKEVALKELSVDGTDLVLSSAYMLSENVLMK
jgi:hypothetical protein